MTLSPSKEGLWPPELEDRGRISPGALLPPECGPTDTLTQAVKTELSAALSPPGGGPPSQPRWDADAVGLPSCLNSRINDSAKQVHGLESFWEQN